MKKMQTAMSLRNGTLDALVALVDEDPPTVLVDVEVQRSAEELGRRLDAQGVRLERYLEATGRTLEELIAELRTQAIPSVKADLALRAVADEVGIEPSEAELEAFMERMAVGAGVSPAVLREQVERAGRRLAVRSDLKKSKAFDWLVEHAEVTDEEGNGVDRALLVRAGQGLDPLSPAGGADDGSDEPGGAE